MKKLLLTSAMMAGLAVFSVQASRPTTVQLNQEVTVESAARMMSPSKVMKPRLYLGDSKVLQSREIANGAATMQLVQDADGFIHKRYITKDRVLGDRIKEGKPVLKAVVTPTYFEGFEGYKEDFGYDWIPPTMTEKNLPENVPTEEQLAKYDNLTWMTYFSGLTPMLPSTTDGICEAFIHFDYDRENPNKKGEFLRRAREQDEWLITPAITPKENEDLYFIAAIEPISVYSTDSIHFSWDIFDFIKPRECVNNLSVMISVDDGKNWVEAWNAEKDVFHEMSNDYILFADFDYDSYKVDLSAYRGKPIKIAFRYWRAAPHFSGNSMCLDAIMVGVPESEACYRRPNGGLIAGFSQDFIAMNAPIIVLPPYVSNQWLNASGTYANTFEWKFADPANPEEDYLCDVANPSMQYLPSFTPAPALTASVGGINPSSFRWGASPEKPDNPSFVQYGGDMLVLGPDETPVVIGLGNFDKSKRFTAAQFGEGQYCFGTGAEDMWGGTVDAIANSFSKPAAPYAMSNLWVQCQMDADADTEFTLIVHEVSEYGYLGDTLAVSTCFANEAVVTDIQGEKYYSIPFKFYKEDEFGYEVESFIDIESKIMVEFKGFNNPEKVRMFAPFNQYQNCDGNENNCYAYFLVKDAEGKTKRRLLDASELLIDFNSSFLFQTDAVYNWMKVDRPEFVAPVEGGSKVFDVETYYDPQPADSEFKTWWIETEDKAAMDEWVTTEFTKATETEGPKMTVTATALPEGVQGRHAKFTLNSIGASVRFDVFQGDAGVQGVVASQVAAKVVDGKLVVNYSDGAKAMRVVNAAGQVVASYELPQTGQMEVDAANLARGIYMVQFDNNQVVKFIK